MHIWAMILAAGQGSRLAAATDGVPKQFLALGGAPLYWRSAGLFAACARIRGLVFVFPPDRLAAERERLQQLGAGQLGLPWVAVAGGAERNDSVRLGLAGLGKACDAVLVHDAARPFASPALVNRVMDALERGCAGVIPGIPVTDTIKESEPLPPPPSLGKVDAEQGPGKAQEQRLEGARRVVATLPRERLTAVQTPQGFRLAVLAEAHALAAREAWRVTDDASLLERCGHEVVIVAGEAANRKITAPEDLSMLREQETLLLPRTGFGYDVHKFADAQDGEGADAGAPLVGETRASRKAGQPARPMRLGGVAIAEGPMVLAHSDGDVLLHALMDAVLGCAGRGDIGRLFPDSDPAFAGCDSAVLLDEVLRQAHEAGLRLVHADVTIITQVPKVAPHREAIRRNVARLLGLDSSCVNVKATTEEGLGFTGEKRGIKAVAVVTALAGKKPEKEGRSGDGGSPCGF